MKHVIPNSIVFLSIKDFVEVEFNGITFYGFVLVVATDYVLVWVGRDSQLSTTDNTIIIERSDFCTTVTKFFLDEGARWSDDAVGSMNVSCSEGMLSEFILHLGSYDGSIEDLLRLNQLTDSFIQRFFRDV